MIPSTITEHFQGIWRRMLNEPSLDAVTAEQISAWAAAKGLTSATAQERDVGAFATTKGIVLSEGTYKAFFPKIPVTGNADWELRRRAANKTAALWDNMEWFSPLWVANGKVKTLLSETEYRTKQQASDLFNYHTSTMYTLAFQAVCIAQIMPSAHSLKEFCPIAREAYLAFYSGYRASSISALIPVIEGGLTRIVPGNADRRTNAKIDRVVDGAIHTAARINFEQMWVPQQYMSKEYLFGQDERIFIFETFGRWLKNSFFRKTDEYSGVTWLNRHLFAHGTASSWQQSANFSRLVVALATLGVIESWHDDSHHVSLLLPEMNDDSKLLWQQALFRGQAQHQFNLLEQKHYQEHGRLVPEMPTDNGALLRQALLSEDCIKDLVRPLRDAGWQIEVGEPDEEGLYVTVTATADGERFGAALLFGCATANAIYKTLAETCDAILYRGAPYRQDQFAYGIDAHVGPIAGWQPPLVPSRRQPLAG
jgi:hypothetical protein